MVVTLIKKIFGTSNERIIADLRKTVERINALEPEFIKLTDAELQQKTQTFREKLAASSTLDDILPEAFATVREASKRVFGMRHFDVQLIGGMVLHKGMIAEMKTGEGKTLMATLAAYLNALEGKGVHVVTVNDYLAQRDANWMGRLYQFLGLSVGCIIHGITDMERREAYAADITYGTNNEYGFDYLRDNMKYSHQAMVQRDFNFAIVDEVDSILIDEARTPLIISGPTEDNSELYIRIDRLIPKLSASDYEVDEKAKTAVYTDEGTSKIEELLKEAEILPPDSSLYDMESVSIVHHINQALRAHKLFTRDVDYIVKNNKVVIIDEFTGRMMEGRRYSEGLHQALEAKERVTVQNENQTLASITFQNYFRLYPKLAGMTGTAMTEATEFGDIYKLEVVEIPTHVPVKRKDEDDVIYRTAREKYDAICKLIAERHKEGQPILVGTVSIEKSELISSILQKHKIPHQVLNARYHEKEAYIIAQAGRFGAVTIATNMAGRGTDIMLGGNPDMRIEHELGDMPEGAERDAKVKEIQAQVAQEKEKVLAAGGLYVIGTERHESRRIDNQLRGRSGRQGDPGHTKFFLSLEDDLMRIFGSDKIGGVLQKLGLKDGEAIQHPWINRSLEKAQQRVEARNYDIRKNLLKFDDVMNDQRKVVYEQRLELMATEDMDETIHSMWQEVNEEIVARHIPENSYAEQWNVEELAREIQRIYGLALPVADWAAEEGVADQEILERLNTAVAALFEEKMSAYSPDIFRAAQMRVVLFTLDYLWKEHLHSLDHLRQGINLRAYGQKDPLNEYKREAFYLFRGMLNQLRSMVISRLAKMELTAITEIDPDAEMQPTKLQETRIDPALTNAGIVPNGAERQPISATYVRRQSNPSEREAGNPESWGRVGRNEMCPCGSGKKYKHCHGAV